MILGAGSAPFYHDTTTQVAIITTIGLIITALIGVFTARITSGARHEATESADIAKDYASALRAKAALIDSLEERVQYLETHVDDCKKKVDEMERREDEYREQQRIASGLERNYSRELDDLRSLVEELRDKKKV